MARSPWLKPDARHDPDTKVDVMRRVWIEVYEISLGDLGLAGGAFEPQRGVQLTLVVVK